MRIFHFSEQPYADAWVPENPSLRISLPNSVCDPKQMAAIYHQRLDEWLLADELGLDLMVNEHHATATCVCPIAAIPLAILARQTRRARILTLGYPIANRLDPVRAAEELAMIDVISRGRLEMGLIRGVQYEVPLALRSAVGQMDRFWEAHDLILKALATRDGPFDWQGEHFQYRNINVWPQPWQQPHPPVWITGRSPQNVREIADRGYVLGTLLSGYQTRQVFDLYRQRCAELGRPAPGADRFAYLGFVAIAGDRREARRRAEVMAGYLRTASQVAEPFASPAGYFSVPDAARMLKGGGRRLPVDLKTSPIEDFVKEGLMFVGTPDDVYEQLARFNEGVGGLGNFLMMAHAGRLTHEEAVDQITLMAREVLPRLQQHRVGSGPERPGP
jgi:alkanesulfonate monooxygenase SsuD/methylene tetrahydromethanopterin reductase-like flavin-dependent oxidoreductase (luciferase family)